MSRQKWYVLGAVIVLAVGVMGTAALVHYRPRPEIASPPVLGRLVRTLSLRKQIHTFWVSGYGTVRPKTEVTVVPEVSGRVVGRSSGFRNGGFIKKDDLLFEIDPTDYQLALTQRKAQIEQLEADIARLRQEERNHRADLAIGERQLEVVRKELERNRQLSRQGVISPGALDVSVQAFLGRERAVQSSRNAIALIPSQIDQKKAALAVTRAQLEEALLNLRRARILAPFDGRVRQAKMEVGDYAQRGQAVGTIYDVSAVEVPVSIPVEDARWALRRAEGLKTFPKSQEEIQGFFPSADVLWTRFGQVFRWGGRVTLVEAGLDEATRALTLIVEVKEPFKGWDPGNHPPLTPGMFTRVRIEGVTMEDVFVVPRSAVRLEDRVYVLKDGMLEVRKVEVIRRSQDEAVIRDGLREGEQIIISAIPDAIPGIRLRAVKADGTNTRHSSVPTP